MQVDGEFHYVDRRDEYIIKSAVGDIGRMEVAKRRNLEEKE